MAGKASSRVAVAVAGVALAVGTLSLLWASIPQFDPSGWLVWGRGVFGPPPFSTLSYPSWKPLPALFTIPLGLTGGVAPALWLVIARAAVVLLAVAVFRVARRWGGLAGGVFAVVGLLFVPRLVQTAGWGDTEPLVAALVVGAVDRHLAGRRGQALALLTLASLGRPEAWALLAPYAVWALGRRAVSRRGLALAVLVVPVLWFGGDLVGSGDAFNGSALARLAVGPAGTPDASVLVPKVLGYALDAASPAWLAVAFLSLAPFARARRATLVMLAAILAWIGSVVFQAAQGYPIEARFLIPVGALICVLAGAGLGGLTGRLRSAGVRAAVLAVAAVAAVVTLVGEQPGIAAEVDGVDSYQLGARGLDRAVAAADRLGVVAPCHVTSSHPFQARLAWRLDRTTSAVAVPSPVGLAFERRRVLDGRLLRFLDAEGDRVRVTRIPLPHVAPWILLRLDGAPRGPEEARCRRVLSGGAAGAG